MSGKTTAALASASPETSDLTELKQLIVQDLNAIVSGGSIHEEARFAGIPLRKETRELLRSVPHGSDLLRLNGLLVEDAYRDALAGHPDRLTGDAFFPRHEAVPGWEAGPQGGAEPPPEHAGEGTTVGDGNPEAYRGAEPRPVRHLREFGRFLMPRVGFFKAETWAGVVAVLGGMLPAMAAATALLVGGWCGWLFLWEILSGTPTRGAALPDSPILLLAALVALCLPVTHVWGQQAARRTATEDGGSRSAMVAATLLAVAGPAAAALLHRHFGPLTSLTLVILAVSEWVFWRTHHASKVRGPREWLAFGVLTLVATGVVGLAAAEFGPRVSNDSPHLLQPADVTKSDAPGFLAVAGAALWPVLGWLCAPLVLLVIRVVVLWARFQCAGSLSHAGRGQEDKDILVVTGVVERTIARLLGAFVVWTLLSLIWAAAELLRTWKAPGVGTVGLTTAGLMAALAWLRGWLMAPPSTSRLSNFAARALRLAGRAAYGLAANLALAGVLVLVALGCQALLVFEVPLGYTAQVATVFLAVTLVLFNPAHLGLHELYRSRIARAFLGAAHASGTGDDRTSEEQPEDDITLGALRADVEAVSEPQARRPIHLVCCAANDLAGDHFATLSRGACSATVSPLGIALGDHYERASHLRLSSALTASAAAFNSHMGSISMNFGPAVAFLMSALNLRLGLWVPNPARRRDGWLPPRVFPGYSYFLELLGLTRVSMPQVHLSDGGHFENLALYELVRRHCRYIIVSDCGADPDVAFDDLGNAIRRIREDFGVEIELDVTPLRPGSDGRSRQHAVIGTIHYDGPNGFDKGALLYFKPALTGDEPPDIQQYQARNQAFPHESTLDQFYDEPQWESYRRLGEHAARAVLAGAAGPCRDKPSFMDCVFTQLRAQWQPGFEQLSTALLDLSQRLRDLETSLREKAPRHLRTEFFPEFRDLGLMQPTAPSGDEEFEAITFLVGVVQLLEDIWLAADLDRHWAHPLNAGWMAYVHRWAAVPTLRRWWPLLRSMYTPGFGDFMKDRAGLRLSDAAARPGENPALSVAELRLVPCPAGVPDRMAWRIAQTRAELRSAGGDGCFSYELVFKLAGSKHRRSAQVGFLGATSKREGSDLEVSWREQDLWVPPFLIGAGIIARFLDAVLAHFQRKIDRDELYAKVVLDVSFDPRAHEAKPGDQAATGCGRAGGSPTQSPHARGTEPVPTLSAAERLRRTHSIEFYRSRGFRYSQPAGPDEVVRLIRTLSKSPSKGSVAPRAPATLPAPRNFLA